MIIDATNIILGRLASFAAKHALLGETIEIINCENAVITGNKKRTLEADEMKKDLWGVMAVGQKNGPQQPGTELHWLVKYRYPLDCGSAQFRHKVPFLSICVRQALN